MIIVTGGSGLVGKALRRLHPEYTYLSSADGDLRSWRETVKIFKKHRPSAIIHLASVVGGLYKNMDNNYDMFMDNLAINKNIIRACQKFKVTQGIFVLSTCVFPDKTTYPINETMLHNGPPHCSNQGYAYAKRSLEIMCRLHNEAYGTKFLCVIPTNMYGIEDNFNLEDAHVIPNLIHKAYVADVENRSLSIKGTGKALRQFLYVDDFARMITELLTQVVMNDEIKEIKDAIVCAPQEEISIQMLAELIEHLFEFPNGIEYDSSFSDGQLKKTADGSVLTKLLPNFRYTPLITGLKTTIQWFKRNYPNIRK